MSDEKLFKVGKFVLTEKEFFHWLNLIDTKKGILVVRQTFKNNTAISTIFFSDTLYSAVLGLSEIFEVMKFNIDEKPSEYFRTKNYEQAMKKHEEFLSEII